MERADGYTVAQSWVRRHQGALFLVALAVLSRILPHPDNVTALAALGLFAGAYVKPRGFLLVPVVAALLADLFVLGTYPVLLMAFVYTGLLLSSLAGRALLMGQGKTLRLPLAILASATGFFLLSNLGDWLVYGAATDLGLFTWYINALPFFGRSLMGDALYAVVFFGLYEGLLALQARRSPTWASLA